MRVLVTGASGNVGSAVLRELTADGRHEVRAVARRLPQLPVGAVGAGSVEWRAADVSVDDLTALMAGVEAVVHLAWKFQPTHRPEITWQTNAVGSRRVLEAARAAEVSTVVCASSVAAYSPHASDELVDESWATDGASHAVYCREKAYVERVLDAFELAHPAIRVVRLRPAFVFQRSAASEQRRIFGGPLARPWLLDRSRIPVVPVPAGLRLQAVHAGDVASAVAAVLRRPVRGAFNLAGHGVLRRGEVEELMSARAVEVPARMAGRVVGAAWRMRAVGAPSSLLDALMWIPLLSADRARNELGWRPRHTAFEAVEAMLKGLPEQAGSTMPPLEP